MKSRLIDIFECKQAKIAACLSPLILSDLMGFLVPHYPLPLLADHQRETVTFPRVDETLQDDSIQVPRLRHNLKYTSRLHVDLSDLYHRMLTKLFHFHLIAEYVNKYICICRRYCSISPSCFTAA